MKVEILRTYPRRDSEDSDRKGLSRLLKGNSTRIYRGKDSQDSYWNEPLGLLQERTPRTHTEDGSQGYHRIHKGKDSLRT
jgi:hypothetical protein